MFSLYCKRKEISNLFNQLAITDTKWVADYRENMIPWDLTDQEIVKLKMIA